MSCNCSGCRRGKQISTLRQLQPDEVVCRKGSGKYPTKSKKIHMDRYLAARATLLRCVQWYKEAHERGKKRNYYDFFHRPITRSSWGVKKYREARAVVKKLGLI